MPTVFARTSPTVFCISHVAIDLRSLRRACQPLRGLRCVDARTASGVWPIAMPRHGDRVRAASACVRLIVVPIERFVAAESQRPVGPRPGGGGGGARAAGGG